MAQKAKKQRNRDRIQVPNGCSYTEPYISPDNWNTAKASIRKKWFIRFTYYDPIHRPDGKSIKWEKTLNNFRNLIDRQEEARKVMEEVLRDLKGGVNPVIGNVLMPSVPIEGEMVKHEFITQATTFKKVVVWAFDQIPENLTKMDMQTYMSHIVPGLSIIRYDKMPIRDITPQHILMLLNAASTVTSRWNAQKKIHVKLTWSNYKHNKCLDYLSMLLNKVMELKVIATNPCHGLIKKTWAAKPKIALLPHELVAIDERLNAMPGLRRFIMIFHASGSRITELMKLQCRDVKLDQYCFYRWVLKKRTRKIIQVRTTISASVMPLWREQMSMCKSPDDYLFSRCFLPGKRSQGSRNVNIHWKRLVQVPLGVKQGPYILKSMYLTALKKKHGSEIAAKHAAHESTDMVDNVYDLDREDSDHERIKSADISFVPRQPLASSQKCVPVSFSIV